MIGCTFIWLVRGSSSIVSVSADEALEVLLPRVASLARDAGFGEDIEAFVVDSGVA